MRIVGGKWTGRQLTSPNDRRVRPTAEHIRDLWLRTLEEELAGARVLELFAGSGAVGLEALSRGAREADFVETRPASVHALKANIAALHQRERTRLFKKDALAFASGLEPDSYRITFADPPYGSRMADRLLEIWQERRFSRVFSLEHAADHPLPEGDHRLEIEGTAITFYRAPAVESGEGEGS
ncbi:MAG TPA: RsmD family RNA methyltransferase [Longimicrobiaceae bacterium]|nr:RsmD family RNA methyltransferase [Longimicrobiaceae bacterium]